MEQLTRMEMLIRNATGVKRASPNNYAKNKYLDFFRVRSHEINPKFFLIEEPNNPVIGL